MVFTWIRRPIGHSAVLVIGLTISIFALPRQAAAQQPNDDPVKHPATEPEIVNEQATNTEQDSANAKSDYRLSVALKVSDSETDEPIEQFRVVPTVVYSSDEDSRRPTWQSHLLTEGHGGKLHWGTDRPWEITRLRIEADGYRPHVTRAIHSGETKIALDIRLQADPGTVGQIVDVAGQPVVGARVAIGTQTNEITVRDGILEFIGHGKVLGRVAITDDEGRFQLPAEVDEWWLVAVDRELGYAERKSEEVTDDPIALEPWAQIEGTLKSKEAPGAGLSIGYSTFRPSGSLSATTYIAQEQQTAADGTFRFERVPAGRVSIHRWFPIENGGRTTLMGLSPGITLAPGQIASITWGGPGRTLIGRVQLANAVNAMDIEELTISLSLPAPHIGFPGDEQIWKVYGEFLKSEEGQRYQRDNVKILIDGSFRIHDVPAGDFDLRVVLADDSGNVRRYVGMTRVSVPLTTNANDDQPINIGTIEIAAP